jgi:hypothetical protein
MEGDLDFELAYPAMFVVNVLFKYACHRMVQALIGEL